jgi:hypothetical protein
MYVTGLGSYSGFCLGFFFSSVGQASNRHRGFTCDVVVNVRFVKVIRASKKAPNGMWIGGEKVDDYGLEHTLKKPVNNNIPPNRMPTHSPTHSNPNLAAGFAGYVHMNFF